MSLNFQEVRKQIKEMGQQAGRRAQEFNTLLQQALGDLAAYAGNLDAIRGRIDVVNRFNPNLRCAVPLGEALNLQVPAPSLPEIGTLLAADGSQINPDRHGALDYCLVNAGVVAIPYNYARDTVEEIRTRLYYDQEMFTERGGRINANQVALWRDLAERELLAQSAPQYPAPVFALVDGPLELWFGSDTQLDLPPDDAGSAPPGGSPIMQKYASALSELAACGARAAGYIDKPYTDLVLRMLEIAVLPVTELAEAGYNKKYRGLTDASLFAKFLEAGCRSAIFELRSRPTLQYQHDHKIHFFYLNVGRPRAPWIARVEVPKWVAADETALNQLHAILLFECNKLSYKPYPYILHRSHEVAVVTREEKSQIEMMMSQELLAAGNPVGAESHKQVAKNSAAG